MKDIYNSNGDVIVDTKKLLDSFNTMKMVLTLKETDELVHKIVNDARRKLDNDTNMVCVQLKETLENTYKSDK
jgi:hypothetical protein